MGGLDLGSQKAELERSGRPLPRYVQEEFEAYLKCGRLEHGFPQGELSF